MSEELSSRLGRNLRQLRQARGLTQQQMAKLSGLPRATWSNLESGDGNPTLTVLHAVAMAFQVSLEEIVAEPRASAKLYRRGSLPTRLRGPVQVSSLLPDKVPGMQIERLLLPVGARMVGVPHTAGTREYLSCESGELTLIASGEAFEMNEGDVVVFRGDQRHSYLNRGRKVAVGYSVVMLRPIE
ncbi:MAG TPA: helix-turn-helix domain-containing protein [Polyangiaceae bacterium]|nr:helix-turn-helix domain-containing protein [Polyangiaceae bacterium]